MVSELCRYLETKVSARLRSMLNALDGGCANRVKKEPLGSRSAKGCTRKHCVVECVCFAMVRSLSTMSVNIVVRSWRTADLRGSERSVLFDLRG